MQCPSKHIPGWILHDSGLLHICCDGESVDMFTNSFVEDVEIMYTHDGCAFIFILLSIVAQIRVEGYSLFFVQCLHNNAVNLSCNGSHGNPTTWY